MRTSIEGGRLAAIHARLAARDECGLSGMRHATLTALIHAVRYVVSINIVASKIYSYY